MIEEPIKYIQKVEIQGLFGRYDVEWNLHPDVNVLAGINGSGKTTILNFIYRLFQRKSPHKEVKNFSISFNNKKSVYFKWQEESDITIDGIDRTSLVGVIFGIDINDINKAIDIKLISTFDSEAKPKELLQKTGNEVKTELDYELWLLQKEYTKYQVRIYKYDSEINRTTHIRFLAMVDELFLETNKKVNPNKEELEFLLGDKEINAYQLSSGEKQLLVILLTVLVQDNKPAILLMDEPEISLHIEWQRKLIKHIRELNPNVQIIIATHSPDIIIKGWLDKVVNIEDIIVKDNAAA